MPSRPDEADVSGVLRALAADDRAELDKVAIAFDHVTGLMIQAAEREIELREALGDGEGKVKQQIVLETMKAARRIFRTCHLQVAGREPLRAASDDISTGLKESRDDAETR